MGPIFLRHSWNCYSTVREKWNHCPEKNHLWFCNKTEYFKSTVVWVYYTINKIIQNPFSIVSRETLCGGLKIKVL